MKDFSGKKAATTTLRSQKIRAFNSGSQISQIEGFKNQPLGSFNKTAHISKTTGLQISVFLTQNKDLRKPNRIQLHYLYFEKKNLHKRSFTLQTKAGKRQQEALKIEIEGKL